MTDCIIIGSGLAGVTAAVYLSEKGYRVHVIEANHYLGGRTSSWKDDSMEMESGLHRYLGFYSALPAVLKKVGVQLDDIIYWEDEIEIRTPDGKREVFDLAPLRRPLGTARTLFGHFNYIPLADKITLGRMFGAGLRLYATNPNKLDSFTVLEFARKYKVSERAIRRVLTPLTEGIFFMSIDQYSMHNLIGLFAPYISTLPKLRVGAFKGGMSDVLIQPMIDFVMEHNGSVTLNTPVRRLKTQAGRVTGVHTDKGDFSARHVILAASLKGAQDILRTNFTAAGHFDGLFALPTMPAVTFQMELTRPSMKKDRTTFGPTTALASFAEQSRSTFPGSNGRLSVILSPPENFIHPDEDSVLETVVRDAKRLGIQVSETVASYKKVVLEHDFYSLAPGSEALRPPQETPVAGLTLAGDYTKQPYLATMEGAVVSGEKAAAIAARTLSSS